MSNKLREFPSMQESIGNQVIATESKLNAHIKSNSKDELTGLRQNIQAIFYNNPDQYPPIINGIRLLTRAGFKVEIFCRDNGERWNISYPSESQVKRIDTRSGSSWREYLGFIKQVWKLGNPQSAVFVGHDLHGLLPAWLLSRRFRRPLIYHCHDYTDSNFPIHTIGNRLVYLFQKQFARTANLITIPDADLGEVMTRELRLRESPMTVANAPIKPTSATGERLRLAVAARNKRFEKIVFRQGRIGEGHAIENTLRSIKYWKSANWGFVVMGISENSYLDKLAQLAQSLQVEEQFLILPPVGYDEVLEFTSGADLGHALYEPININNRNISGSNKIQEYLSAGLPLLVSNRPALKALIEKYQCGLSADENSPEDIARAINTILEDEELAMKLGKASASAFKRELCFERQFGPVIERIQKLIALSS